MSEENQTEKKENVEDKSTDQSEIIKDLKAQVLAMQGKANELLDETKKAKNKAREEAAAKELAELDKARKSGDYEQMLKSSEEKRAELEDKLKELNTKVGSEKTKRAAMKIAAELADGSNAELLSEFVSRRIKYTDEGVKVTTESGELTVSTLDQLKQEFEVSDKYRSLLRGNKASGGGAAGAGSGATSGKTITRNQFDALSNKDKFIADGGKVINE